MATYCDPWKLQQIVYGPQNHHPVAVPATLQPLFRTQHHKKNKNKKQSNYTKMVDVSHFLHDYKSNNGRAVNND